MFCGRCGKEITTGAKFCESCGAPISESERPLPSHKSRSDNLQMWMKKHRWVALIGILLLVYLGVEKFYSSDVAVVRNGHFDMNQTITIGKAFSQFFDEPAWSSKVINDTHYVYFKGKCEDVGTGGIVQFQAVFVINNSSKRFQLTNIQIGRNDYTYAQGDIIRQILDGNHQISLNY